MTNEIDTAIHTINTISKLPDESCDIYIAIRSLLIDPYDTEPMPSIPNADPFMPMIRSALRTLFDDERTDDRPYYSRAALSDLMLNYSLCPMHRIDYAICFDDDDPDCAAIRAYFPIHDS